jgi:nicotinamide-nucleotide adenylyltransferase
MIYDSGLIVGRFQTFHKGHQSLVETGLKLCDRVLILVGSAQENGTERNPFNIATRIEIIKNIYGDNDRISIYGLSDLTHENDISIEWGKYLLTNVDRYIFKAPELMIYGNDEARSKWFDPEDIKDTAEFIIPRGRLPISATMIREMMIKDERKEWMKWVDPKIHKLYDKLRSELMSIPYYQKLALEVR